jgi:hypothetical protein
MLRGGVYLGKFVFFRNGSDGTQQGDYAVPSGMSLVTTDVVWSNKKESYSAGSLVSLVLTSTALGPPFLIDSVVVPAGGKVASYQHLTTGFVVASGQKVIPTSSPSGSLPEMTFHGYLVG